MSEQLHSEQEPMPSISQAQDFPELFNALRAIGSIEGEDGKIYSAEELEQSISIIWKNADAGKAILVDLPTEELTEKVRELVSKWKKSKK